jgi:hypothetical protein
LDQVNEHDWDKLAKEIKARKEQTAHTVAAMTTKLVASTIREVVPENGAEVSLVELRRVPEL